jgi:hypothetical protein
VRTPWKIALAGEIKMFPNSVLLVVAVPLFSVFQIAGVEEKHPNHQTAADGVGPCEQAFPAINRGL